MAKITTLCLNPCKIKFLLQVWLFRISRSMVNVSELLRVWLRKSSNWYPGIGVREIYQIYPFRAQRIQKITLISAKSLIQRKFTNCSGITKGKGILNLKKNIKSQLYFPSSFRDYIFFWNPLKSNPWSRRSIFEWIIFTVILRWEEIIKLIND